MRRPDFFLVGAPKCGTTLMDNYLRVHPDLYLPMKELHYFGADLHFNEPARTLDNYLSFFQAAPENRRSGESSTWYLYSRTAAREIADFCPTAQILIMLRNPVSMLHSLHSHLFFTGDEDIPSFEDALGAESDRAGGRRVPANSFPAGALLYHDVARFSDQVQRYYDAFGRDRVKIVLADDFKKDPPGVYRDVLKYLGVATDFPGFEAALTSDNWTANVNKSARSRKVVRFLKIPINQSVRRGLSPEPVPGWRTVLRAIRRANIQYTERPPMAPETRKRLTVEFTPEIERLSRLIDRDLSAWLKA